MVIIINNLIENEEYKPVHKVHDCNTTCMIHFSNRYCRWCKELLDAN